MLLKTMENTKSCLENLKSEYKILCEKYSLPEFNKLNEDFSIEKLAEIETDFLLKEIRRFISEKFSNYLRLIESIIHPVNSPIFVFAIIKSLSQEDLEKLREVYKKLVQQEIKILRLDLLSLEKEEADYIKNSFETWQEIKKDLLEIVDEIEANWNNKFEENNKSYFG